jgi:hypothetical protein
VSITTINYDVSINSSLMSPHHRASAVTLQLQLVAMPPAVSSAKVKRYCCGICSNGFDKRGNLTRHESTHAEHATPEAIAKRLKEKEYLRTYRRERREKDPVYRAREKQISRKNRANKKLRVGTAVPDGGESPKGTSAASSKNGGSVRGDVDRNVNISHTNVKKDGVFQVETAPLTNESIAQFFAPKYSASRSNEQRLATLRSSI